MTGPPPITVAIVADDQLTPSIQTIAAGASNGLSPVQRFAKALTLSEAREGTVALRTMRSGFAELAIAAGGVSAPVGRVLESLLAFGTGSEELLLITGGIAAIAVAWKLAAGEAEHYAKVNEDAQKQFGETAVHGPGAGIVEEQRRLRVLQQQRDRLYQQIAGIRAESNPRDPYRRYDPADAAAKIEAAETAVATVRSNILTLERQITEEMKKQTGELERRAARFRHQETPSYIARQAGELSRMFGGIFPTDLESLPGRRSHPLRLGAIPVQPFEDLDLEGRISGRRQRPFEEEGGLEAIQGPNGAALATAGTRAIMDLIRGTQQRGGAGALSGLGAGLTAVAPFAKGLPALGPAGAAVSGVAELVSFMSSGKHKVTISAYDQQALEQMKTTRGDPLTTSTTVLGDARDIAYAINRDAERGVLPRGI